ncbi:PaaI family thioesterase [Novosphingobium terrae]|uniref:PaaI family thioesterase n=1 Tax=Novosphingobium terrae TaxID=2726189 RepID=UPI001981B79B|nr:PaaI family thioesterase [Novosphingobium terrae]
MSGVDQVLALKEVMSRSPMMRLLEVEVISAHPGEVVMRATPDHRFDNQVGIAHGGYIASLLDNACGAAAHSVLDGKHYCLTLEIKVAFLRAIDANSGPLDIIGRVQKGGRQVVVTEGVIRDARGTDLATATSTLIVQPIPTAS